MDAFDLAVIGGGIHGAAIARDAAGRGLSVLLLERGDLGGETSSASSKLIHGGLRYLEHLELRLVREALAEREILLAAAPHLVRPLPFVLPIEPGSRPAWMLRFGLALYDRMGGRRTLPGSHAIRLPGTPFGAPLRPELVRGFLYSDARADDARLVLAHARGAAAVGADVRPRTELIAARREPSAWRLQTRPSPAPNGALPRGVPRAPAELSARAVVNAAGPWTVELLRDVLDVQPRRALRLVKGSHVVVPRLYAGGHAYILQQPDRRVVFLIPYADQFTLIGTTEVVVERPAHVEIDAAEIDYLCAAAARFLREPPSPRDVRWSFAGLRPLLDDGRASASAVTRDYALTLDTDAAPLLSLFGGKLTTHRRLAERAVDALAPALGNTRGPWTADAPLPGGSLPPGADADVRVAAALRALRAAHPELSEPLARGLLDRHGSEAAEVLAAGDPREALPGITEAEVTFSVTHEWAACAEDLLWRRSKIGLHTSPQQRLQFETFILQRLHGAAGVP
jgi:glycerol-3-phosphate dehydrogenase